MNSNNNYPYLRAFEETTTSIYPLGHHLDQAVLTMNAFWPIFLAFIISSEWVLVGEITFALF
jgi:hypothetical protein